MKLSKKGIFSLVLAACIPAFSYADVAMNFKGTLTIPQCTVNGSDPINVDFKEVQIQTLTAADVPYQLQQVTVPVSCAYSLGKPKVTLTTASPADATKGSIQTSKYSEGLVVYVLKADGVTPIPLDNAFDVSDSMSGTGNDMTLSLNAGVGRTGPLEDLTPGTFDASATMQLSYQ